jgi:hypothetical protein
MSTPEAGPAGGASTGEDRDDPIDIKELYRQQIRDSIGGFSGVVITAVPTVVFVIANATSGLRTAIIAAVASAVLLSIYRYLRKQPLQQAASGLFGVVIAALIAAKSHQAKGFFLWGIWTSFAYGGVLLLSVLLRRPFGGLLWEFVDPTPGTAGAQGDDETNDEAAESDEDLAPSWYRIPVLYRAYQLATLGFILVFGVRGVVQLTLFRHDATGWLAVAKIGLGLPPYLGAIAFAVWIVRRARHKFATDQNSEEAKS